SKCIMLNGRERRTREVVQQLIQPLKPLILLPNREGRFRPHTIEIADIPSRREIAAGTTEHEDSAAGIFGELLQELDQTADHAIVKRVVFAWIIKRQRDAAAPVVTGSNFTHAISPL